VASIFKRMSGFLSRVKSMARVFADADDSCTRIGSGKLSALFLPVDVVTPNYSSTLSNPHLILGDRREDLSPKRTGDLHSHVTNPARSRVHQHLLAGTDISPPNKPSSLRSGNWKSQDAYAGDYTAFTRRGTTIRPNLSPVRASTKTASKEIACERGAGFWK
jgi:hypothetical protein